MDIFEPGKIEILKNSYQKLSISFVVRDIELVSTGILGEL